MSAADDVHSVGCCRVNDRPAPDPEEQQWSCQVCDARIWVSAPARRFMAEEPRARPVCYQCMARILDFTGGELHTLQY